MRKARKSERAVSLFLGMFPSLTDGGRRASQPVDLSTIEELVRGRGRQTDDGTGLGPANELDESGAVSPG